MTLSVMTPSHLNKIGLLDQIVDDEGKKLVSLIFQNNLDFKFEKYL